MSLYSGALEDLGVFPQFTPCCPAEPPGDRGAAALSLEFLGLWGQVVACSGGSQGVSGQALGISKGVPEEGDQRRGTDWTGRGCFR